MTATDTIPTVTFNVDGDPVTQGSMTAYQRGGKTVMVPGGTRKSKEKLDRWRGDITYQARNQRVAHGIKYNDGEPVAITLAFRMPRVTTTRKKDVWHTKQSGGDLDKLVRAVGDALTASNIINDDGQIASIQATKTYAAPDEKPGVTITITPLN